MKSPKKVFRVWALCGVALACALSFVISPQAAQAQDAEIGYQSHVQTYGWQESVSNGATSGTVGESKRLEAIELSIQGADVSGSISYRAHCQTYGWMDWVEDGELAGTTGEAKRLEAIQIRLSGRMAEYYDIFYRVHVEEYGWLGWSRNGEVAGTTGEARRLEAIEVYLMKKASMSDLPGVLNYQTHQQTYAWLNWASDGDVSGVTGHSKRLEAMRVYVDEALAGVTGDVVYRAYVQDRGWRDWRANGEFIGTVGEAKRMEAVQIKLAGELERNFDVYYSTHIQNMGWLGWAKNGAASGSTDEGLRIEAIRIVLVRKGDAAPGNTNGFFYESNTSASIMGRSQATEDDCVQHFYARSKYPTAVYASKGAASMEDFVSILFEEAQAEGVRADVVYAQSMFETDYLRFGNDVSVTQCNFAGIGATGNKEPGNTFKDVRTGLRAQVQHLKAYASTASLRNACVDPRFNYVERGVAPTLIDLNGRWASATGYGEAIGAILADLDAMS